MVLPYFVLLHVDPSTKVIQTLVADKREHTIFSSSLGLVTLLWMIEKQDGCPMIKVYTLGHCGFIRVYVLNYCVIASAHDRNYSLWPSLVQKNGDNCNRVTLSKLSIVISRKKCKTTSTTGRSEIFVLRPRSPFHTNTLTAKGVMVLLKNGRFLIRCFRQMQGYFKTNYWNPAGTVGFIYTYILR